MSYTVLGHNKMPYFTIMVLLHIYRVKIWEWLECGLRANICGPTFAGQNLRANICGPTFAGQNLRANICGPKFAGHIFAGQNFRVNICGPKFAGQYLRANICGSIFAGQHLRATFLRANVCSQNLLTNIWTNIYIELVLHNAPTDTFIIWNFSRTFYPKYETLLPEHACGTATIHFYDLFPSNSDVFRWSSITLQSSETYGYF